METTNYEKTVVVNAEELVKEECLAINPKTEGKLLQEITLSLKNTMRKNKLNYLAAPQIGYFKRVFCIRTGVDAFKTFVNPMILKSLDKTVAYDTCASFPDTGYLIYRFNKIKLGFMTPLGELGETNLTKEVAWAAQQCVDLLDGITIDNYGMKIVDMNDPEMLDNWKNFTDEEKDEIRVMYIESIDGETQRLTKETEGDKEISDIRDGIRFMTSVANGETTLMPMESPAKAPESEEETENK